MRVLVVDDEPAARRRLALMLEELDEEVIGEAANGVQALEMARERKPDVLLLDIEMPEVDGFDVARHLPVPRPLLVFQTAYDEYALRAFDHAALDYLVKPVTLDGLRRALGRARERLEAPSPAAAPADDMLRELRASVRKDAPRRPRLLVREGKGHRLVAFEHITRFTADEGVVFAHLDGGDRRLTDYTLAELEERAGSVFVRASRGELVNAEAVERIVRNGDGSATLGLRGGATVHVSRRRAPDVWERLAE
jgi:DNA-binding LytR/AlgR family response regulator